MQKINNILPTLSLLPFYLDSFIVDRKLLIISPIYLGDLGGGQIYSLRALSEIAARSRVPCHQRVLVGHFSRRKWKENVNRHEWQYHALTEQKSKQPLIKNQMAILNSAIYSPRMTTDIPLCESPGVPNSPLSFFYLSVVDSLLDLFPFRHPSIDIWRISLEFSKQYFLTKEGANNLMRFLLSFPFVFLW
jgi:hypothetical protein